MIKKFKYNLLSDAFNKKDIKEGIKVLKSKKITISKITRNFEKYFAKNATVDFTPVLVFDGGEAEFKTITVQGESAIGGEATIFYANGGSFSYQDKINYSDLLNTLNSIIF